MDFKSLYRRPQNTPKGSYMLGRSGRSEKPQGLFPSECVLMKVASMPMAPSILDAGMGPHLMQTLAPETQSRNARAGAHGADTARIGE